MNSLPGADLMNEKFPTMPLLELHLHVEQELNSGKYRLHKTGKTYLCAGNGQVVYAVNGMAVARHDTARNIEHAEVFFGQLPWGIRELAARNSEVVTDVTAGLTVKSLSQSRGKATESRLIRKFFADYSTSFAKFKAENLGLCNYMRLNNVLDNGKYPLHMTSIYQFPDIYENHIYQMLKVEKSRSVIAPLLSLFSTLQKDRAGKMRIATEVAERCIEWEKITTQHGLSNNAYYNQAVDANDWTALCSLLSGVTDPTREFYMEAVFVLKEHLNALRKDQEFVCSNYHQRNFADLLDQRITGSAQRVFGVGDLKQLAEDIVFRLRSYIESEQVINLATGDLVIPAGLSDEDAACFETYAATLLRCYHRLSGFRGHRANDHILRTENLLNICRVFLQIMKLADAKLYPMDFTLLRDGN